LLLVLIMVVAGTVVFADEPNNDGVIIWGATGDQYNNTEVILKWSSTVTMVSQF
jgi:hypothetical protein